jgi:hypothetical protein
MPASSEGQRQRDREERGQQRNNLSTAKHVIMVRVQLINFYYSDPRNDEAEVDNRIKRKRLHLWQFLLARRCRLHIVIRRAGRPT